MAKALPPRALDVEHPPPSSTAAASGTAHLPALQIAGATQSLETAQVSLHLPVLSQVYGAQSVVVPSICFTIEPVHVAPAVHAPFATSHTNPSLQSESDEQVVLHLVSPQPYG